jgi:hypothetical protein
VVPGLRQPERQPEPLVAGPPDDPDLHRREPRAARASVCGGSFTGGPPSSRSSYRGAGPEVAQH